MSKKGDCFDNAVAESFFATYKRELIAGRSWRTRREALDATREFFESRYDSKRLHSTLDYRTPAEAEFEYHRQELVA